MNVSDSIEADGLEGDFTFVDPEKNHVFISGGIGITPYHAILMDLDHRGLPINVTLLYANKEKDNVVFMNELEALTVKHPNFKVHYFFDPVRGREGSQRASASNGIDPERIDEAAIKRIVPDLTKPLFYVSGPEIMVEAFEKSLPQMGIPEENTKRDYFPGYNWP
jgi:ferredoxin-NADP reductase